MSAAVGDPYSKSTGIMKTKSSPSMYEIGWETLRWGIIGSMVTTIPSVLSGIPIKGAFAFGATFGGLFVITAEGAENRNMVLLVKSILTFVAPFFAAHAVTDESVSPEQILIHLAFGVAASWVVLSSGDEDKDVRPTSRGELSDQKKKGQDGSKALMPAPASELKKD